MLALCKTWERSWVWSSGVVQGRAFLDTVGLLGYRQCLLGRRQCYWQAVARLWNRVVHEERRIFGHVGQTFYVR